MITSFQRTTSATGNIRYWFDIPSENIDEIYTVGIEVSDKKIVTKVCGCKFATREINNKKEFVCKHIKESLKVLNCMGVIEDEKMNIPDCTQ